MTVLVAAVTNVKFLCVPNECNKFVLVSYFSGVLPDSGHIGNSRFTCRECVLRDWNVVLIEI